LLFFHLYCWLGSEPTGEPTRNNLMVGKAGTRTFCYSSGGALLVSRPPPHCNTWQWLVVASSAKQKQQRHQQQLINGSTILNIYVSRKLRLM
jgi:hypothetical protein